MNNYYTYSTSVLVRFLPAQIVLVQLLVVADVAELSTSVLVLLLPAQMVLVQVLVVAEVTEFSQWVHHSFHGPATDRTGNSTTGCLSQWLVELWLCHKTSHCLYSQRDHDQVLITYHKLQQCQVIFYTMCSECVNIIQNFNFVVVFIINKYTIRQKNTSTNFDIPFL